MAKLAQLRNKCLWVVSLLPGLFGCQQQTTQTITIPGRFVSIAEPGWQRREGKLWLNNKLFSGWQYQLWPSGDTAFVGAFYEGKAEGFHRQWYEENQEKEIRHFQNGWQEGEQCGWHESGKQAFIYHFQHDVYEGNCREWYVSGLPAQDKHYQQGQENGLQRMWYADGSLKANYVVRNGRHYGFTGVKNCINSWNPIAASH